jgi:kumamolisin
VPQAVVPGQEPVAHTNVIMLRPNGVNPDESPPVAGRFFETPESLACHYQLGSGGPRPGCNPNVTATVPTGGSNRIAIVDAYDDPGAASDLATFSTQFGLPLTAGQFTVVAANPAGSSCFGHAIPTNTGGGWEFEESLDIEYAHAMAPNAKLYLVETCSNSFADLAYGVRVANNLVKCAATKINPTTGALTLCPPTSTGKGEVSMSFGGAEFSGETSADSCAHFDDSCFTTADIVYVASTGDAPGVEYPSASPNVVAAGGTTIRRNQLTGDVITEAAWTLGGGGQSVFETRPSYQSSVSSIVGTARGVPDLAFDADPHTGVWVYDSFPLNGVSPGWTVVGGTSLSAPALTGIINRAAGFAASSQAELTTLYANMAVAADIKDVTTGFCGFYMGFSDVAGWDFCTGVGVPHTYAGK